MSWRDFVKRPKVSASTLPYHHSGVSRIMHEESRGELVSDSGSTSDGGEPIPPQSQKKEQDGSAENCRRKDFFGRALLSHIAELFPAQGEETSSPEKNGESSLPRQIAPGLIHEMKGVTSEKIIKSYERVFNLKAERYRSPLDSRVDVVAFSNNGTVRSVVANVLKKFEKEFMAKGEDEGRIWLLSAIEDTPRFRELGRSLTEEEYSILRKNLFAVMRVSRDE